MDSSVSWEAWQGIIDTDIARTTIEIQETKEELETLRNDMRVVQEERREAKTRLSTIHASLETAQAKLHRLQNEISFLNSDRNYPGARLIRTVCRTFPPAYAECQDSSDIFTTAVDFIPPIESPMMWAFLNASSTIDQLQRKLGDPSSSASFSSSLSPASNTSTLPFHFPPAVIERLPTLWHECLELLPFFWRSMKARSHSALSHRSNQLSLFSLLFHHIFHRVSPTNLQYYPHFRFASTTSTVVSYLPNDLDQEQTIFLIIEYQREDQDFGQTIEVLGQSVKTLMAATQKKAQYLGLAVGFQSTEKIQYSLYLILDSMVHDNLIRILLRRGVATPQNDDLAHLIFSLAAAGLHAQHSHEPFVDPEYAIMNTEYDVIVGFHRVLDSWIKVYPSNRVASPEISLLRLPGAHLVVDTPSLKIMRYPHIPGDICQSTITPTLFLTAAKALEDLHHLGYAHGDIRLQNLIVDNAHQNATWIDYDHASSTNEDEKKRYPSGWSTDIDDGVRHPDAKRNHPIRPEHDEYSFSSLLQLYEGSDLWNSTRPPLGSSLPDSIQFLSTYPNPQEELRLSDVPEILDRLKTKRQRVA